MSKPFILDPVKEAQAVKALKEGLAAVGAADDAELLIDTIEGQTSLFEIIDELLLRRTESLALADLDTLMRPVGTLSMSKRPASVVITEESEIPAAYWKPGTPTLDKKALTEAVRAHKAALAIEDPELRKAALEAAPAVPGATLNNAAPSLTIRVK